ncbi:molybdate ABC transporter substrate-binding protein [Nocardiopsis sp. MG754419]|uniref:molybdate ABC transporter substrate-binding protein n=1 Tax=Nocardiopsis sp. MG754419 TaxID=2259865 RepID=UPI001BAE231F|nr:molybdate ABC transporter substrate-binding protein [Nocardiopsis sp. MG754419]MBR8740860.1 molybdate ABC transporter substrate-binding protein [Nocardiopsis sp. MG754419]
MRESLPRHPRARGTARGSIAALAALTLALTACSGSDTGDGSEGAGETEANGPAGELTVFAAASLTDVFEEIAASFEQQNPQVEITFNFAGSSELAQQINSGAPADVFAAANTATMEQVVEGEGLDADWAAEHGEDGRVFVTNTLQIAVPPENPAGVEGFADLADEDVAVAFCAEEVPCGAATLAALDSADLDITPVTLEEDVRAVLTKVELNEVDAGLVYATDVISAEGRVEGLDFPEAEEAVNDYPIGVLGASGDPELAAAWVEFVTTEGAPVLQEAGFGTP